MNLKKWIFETVEDMVTGLADNMYVKELVSNLGEYPDVTAEMLDIRPVGSLLCPNFNDVTLQSDVPGLLSAAIGDLVKYHKGTAILTKRRERRPGELWPDHPHCGKTETLCEVFTPDGRLARLGVTEDGVVWEPMRVPRADADGRTCWEDADGGSSLDP